MEWVFPPPCYFSEFNTWDEYGQFSRYDQRDTDSPDHFKPIKSTSYILLRPQRTTTLKHSKGFICNGNLSTLTLGIKVAIYTNLTCCSSWGLQVPWYCEPRTSWIQWAACVLFSCYYHNQCWASTSDPWSVCALCCQYLWASSSFSAERSFILDHGYKWKLY